MGSMSHKFDPNNKIVFIEISIQHPFPKIAATIYAILGKSISPQIALTAALESVSQHDCLKTVQKSCLFAARKIIFMD